IRLITLQTDPSRYYEEADLFVLPSMTEGFPNVLLEAANFYVPIISFDVGGISGIFRNGWEALILKEQTSEALANGIRSFLAHPQAFTEYALRARERIEKDYSIDVKARKLLDYYRSIAPQ
ncbi:MAG: glycosyltransferase, partial [Verrucomicrobiota bacterium]